MNQLFSTFMEVLKSFKRLDTVILINALPKFHSVPFQILFHLQVPAYFQVTEIVLLNLRPTHVLEQIVVSGCRIP